MKLKTIALPLFAMLFTGAFDAQAQTSKAFSRTDSLHCDGSTVSIQSTCSASTDGIAPHCTQKLAFKTAAGADRIVNYEPVAAPHRDESFVSQLSCGVSGSKHYVIAHSGNFANCSTCEWIDVFSLHGELIGSTPSIARALKLPPKKLPRQVESSLSEPFQNQSISIGRILSGK